MALVAVFLISFIGIIWILIVRPLLKKNQSTKYSGASIFQSFFGDWSELGNIARKTGDRKCVLVFRIMNILAVVSVLLVALALVEQLTELTN